MSNMKNNFEWKTKLDDYSGYYIYELHHIGWSKGENIKVMPANEQFIVVGNTPLNGTIFFDSEDAMNAVIESL